MLPSPSPPLPWLARAAPFLAGAAVVLAAAVSRVAPEGDGGSAGTLLAIACTSLGLLCALAVGVATAPGLPVLDTMWMGGLTVLFVLGAAAVGTAEGGGPSVLPVVLTALLVGLVVRRRAVRVARRERGQPR